MTETDPAGVRVKLTVAYDGSGFSGFAAQAGKPTVAGTLAMALEKVVGHSVRLTCAGRTDAGVHARGQVVHADLVPKGRLPHTCRGPHTGSAPDTDALDTDALVRSCNRMLAPRIVVRSATVVSQHFDARRSALSRRYRYSVVDAPVPDPFLAPTAWHVPGPLDIRGMQAACDPLLGEHDFAAFCRRGPRQPAGEPMMRRVTEASWTRGAEGVLRFEIEAVSFCHQMVRSLVGTLVEVGKGRRRASDMMVLLAMGDRSRAGSPAPPHGLCLWEVRYAS